MWLKNHNSKREASPTLEYACNQLSRTTQVSMDNPSQGQLRHTHSLLFSSMVAHILQFKKQAGTSTFIHETDSFPRSRLSPSCNPARSSQRKGAFFLEGTLPIASGHCESKPAQASNDICSLALCKTKLNPFIYLFGNIPNYGPMSESSFDPTEHYDSVLKVVSHFRRPTFRCNGT